MLNSTSYNSHLLFIPKSLIYFFPRRLFVFSHFLKINQWRSYVSPILICYYFRVHRSQDAEYKNIIKKINSYFGSSRNTDQLIRNILTWILNQMNEF